VQCARLVSTLTPVAQLQQCTVSSVEALHNWQPTLSVCPTGSCITSCHQATHSSPKHPFPPSHNKPPTHPIPQLQQCRLQALTEGLHHAIRLTHQQLHQDTITHRCTSQSHTYFCCAIVAHYRQAVDSRCASARSTDMTTAPSPCCTAVVCVNCCLACTDCSHPK
jgi:hypothetical protein